MGRRSRQRRAQAPRVPSEVRNQRIRDELEPLAPGERPDSVTVAAIVAFVLAILNGVATALGETISKDATGSSIIFSIVLLVAAIGMWRAKYWAVLGFQALLGLQIITFTFAAMFGATSVLAAVGLAAGAILGGWLFWKLVRALARLQMPERRPERPPVV
jgi:hypothetical protein